MAQVHKDGDRYFVSYFTGPSHVWLGLVFGRADCEPRMIQQAAIGSCQHGPLDEARIRDAVRDGLGDIQARTGVTLHAAEIIYVANDSPRYDMYRHCARLLAEQAKIDL